MRCRVRSIAPLLLAMCCFFETTRGAKAEDAVGCESFTKAGVAAPTSRDDQHFRERLTAINAAVKAEPHPVLFLGDSITERWTPAIWHESLAPRGVLNAGIDGDRTEHLRWRLEHGNLDGTPPRAVVLLIGTNDLGHGRLPDVAADGIRTDLVYLRTRLPGVRILLLGLTPRSDQFKEKVEAVNQLIKTCNGSNVGYANIGSTLLDSEGRLARSISIDGVHFTELGYQRLTQQLNPLIDRLLPTR